MFQRIILGYAGDRGGRDAAALAVGLARRCGSAVTVVFPYHPLPATVSAEVAEERVRGELAALDDGSGALARATYRWTSRSWPVRALHELAAYERADLIVIGAAPERLGRRRPGLMERMVHDAPCAIAVAPERYADSRRPPLRSIGVGFADSREGRAALAAALRLAGDECEVHLIAAAGLGPALASYGFASASLPAIEEEVYAETTESAQRLVAEVDVGERLSLEVRRGEPAAILCAAARHLDLLVLGSRSYGPVRRVLLGSVSAETMREASCPVLVLPRPPEAAHEPAAPAAAEGTLAAESVVSHNRDAPVSTTGTGPFPGGRVRGARVTSER